MQQQYRNLTPELAARLPLPGTVVPQQIRYVPDGKSVMYLYSGSDTMALSLWRYDIETNSHHLVVGPTSENSMSANEELLRERTRMIWEGITSYQIAEHALKTTVLIPQGGKLFVQRDTDPVQEIPGVRDVMDPYILPDGSRVVYVYQDEVWTADTLTGQARQLTEGAVSGVSHGLAEYAAQEELDRTHGFWVSPDQQMVAFEEVDTRQIPDFPIVHWETATSFVESHRYPFAGCPNAQVRLGVVSIEGGDLLWLDLGSQEQYLARVVWTRDNNLAVMLLSRDHQRLVWRLYDAKTGDSRDLFEEVSSIWVNVGDDTRFLDSGDILTSSEASGFRHLWQFSGADGGGRQITQGPFEIQRLLAVDQAHNQAYVTATRETPLEVHIYQVNLNSGDMVRISREEGIHHAVISPQFDSWIDQSSSCRLSPQTRLMSMDGEIRTIVHGHHRITPEELGLSAPDLVRLTAEDGTLLYGAVYPTKTDNSPVPAIISVYGGTHAQLVVNAWGLTVDLQAQLLSQNGYLVFKMDNRGSYHRGKQFEGAIHKRFGTVELQDQLTGVQWLVKHHEVDPNRIGIYGWSYGGYMTLMAMFKAPEIFRVGVAGAPVTDFRFYDTAYTERYMQTPETNPKGYAEGSTINYVDRLQGHLMVIHGLLDENVHFRNTVQLIDALNKAGKSLELVMLPESRHAVRGFHNVLTVIRRRTQFFLENL